MLVDVAVTKSLSELDHKQRIEREITLSRKKAKKEERDMMNVVVKLLKEGGSE